MRSTVCCQKSAQNLLAAVASGHLIRGLSDRVSLGLTLHIEGMRTVPRLRAAQRMTEWLSAHPFGGTGRCL